MNVVYLSPHFPPHYHRFCSGLKAAGAAVLGIGDAPYDALSGDQREALTEYYRVADMHDYDALVRACGYYTHRYGKIDRFESLNEYWLATEARIRDDFNVFGIRSAGIDNVRRKSRMKTIFAGAGLPVARGAVIASLDHARALVRQTGYPLVVKPDAGVGALDTHKIASDQELERLFDSGPTATYIAEEFISGELCSFDGLTDRNGETVFTTAHRFSQGIMETVNDARDLHYVSMRRIPAGLEEAGRKCLAAFGIRERFFHIEFFRTAADAYVALEVNLRPPGGFTTDMFNYAADIDIYRIWAELVVQGRRGGPYERKYHCAYASRRRRFGYAHSHEEIAARFGDRIVQVEPVPAVFSSALGDIGYIFRSPDLAEIEAMVAYIQAVAG